MNLGKFRRWIVGIAVFLKYRYFNEKYRHQNLLSLCLIFFIASCSGVKQNKSK
jgi:hypothetical protein